MEGARGKSIRSRGGFVATGAFFVSLSQVHPLFAPLQQALSLFRWCMCVCCFVAAGVIFARVVAAGVFFISVPQVFCLLVSSQKPCFASLPQVLPLCGCRR